MSQVAVFQILLLFCHRDVQASHSSTNLGYQVSFSKTELNFLTGFQPSRKSLPLNRLHPLPNLGDKTLKVCY